MVKKLFLIFAALFVMAFSANAGVVFYRTGIHVVQVVDLPADSAYALINEEGEFVESDLGILHEQFQIFWLPVWNYGEEKYVLYYEKGDTINAADLDEEDLAALHADFDFPETPTMPFWHKIGGKIVLVLIIGAYLAYKVFLGRKDDDDETLSTEEGAEAQK